MWRVPKAPSREHGATRQQARQLTGEDYGLRFGEGDAQKWAAFLARGKR